jgi:membrane associated rhomboid family serine protease
MSATTSLPSCYRHPNRETGVACSNCGRPICPDCMTPTPVGMRCPECAQQRTKVKTARTVRQGAYPYATYGLIAMNAIVYFASTAAGGGLTSRGGGSLIDRGGLFGPAIANSNEYWRLVTSGFLHAGLLHLAFNMYFIYVLGLMLEPALGTPRFLAVYFASLLMGSFGALLFSPLEVTVGASGAAFGLLGCAIIVAHARRIDIWASGLMMTLLLNLALSVAIPGISIGGHLGGLIGGLLSGFAIVQLAERRGQPAAAMAVMVGIGIVGIVGAIAVAGHTGLFPHGLSF